MILGFSEKFKNGEPTDFVGQILGKRKIHTIRRGERWRTGMSIQMAVGVRTKNYYQFNTFRPDLSICTNVQSIKIRVEKPAPNETAMSVRIDFRYLSIPGMQRLAAHDGFKDALDFANWFYENGEPYAVGREFTGQIIHWTNLKY